MPDELHKLLSPLGTDGAAMRRFTFHVDFMAVDERQARLQAEWYAQGLGHLRSEVDTYTACVSVEGNWLGSVVVFCGAPGPDSTDVCTDSAGHGGWHHGPGASHRWSDDQAPKAPDIIEDLG